VTKPLTKAARSLAFRSANDALWRDIRHGELVDALRLLRDATAALFARLDPSERAAIEAALAQADRALADAEPRPK
jgi:hypothetical protein